MSRIVFSLPSQSIHYLPKPSDDWQIMTLSGMQTEILWTIVQANGNPVPADGIVARTYADNKPIASLGSLRVHMHVIARKFKEAGIPSFIRSVYGKGYCIIGSIEVIE